MKVRSLFVAGILAASGIVLGVDPMQPSSKIYLAGHTGLVGSALVRALHRHGYCNVITKSIDELDLCNQAAVNMFFEHERPEYVIMSAGRVGGIAANAAQPASFLYQNLAMAANIIDAAYRYGVKKLLYLGSSCIYPKESPQPIKEEYLLTSALEPTNEGYALAKIAGLKLVQTYNKQYGTHFISAMPTNLYGYEDNFDLEKSHVLPALIRKFIDAVEQNLDEVKLWGTGKARREFLFVDDLAGGLIMLMNNYEENMWINIGSGTDISIAELAQMIAELVGFKGRIVFNTTVPDGTMHKLLDVSKINALGWHATTSLKDGLQKTIEWYKANRDHYIKRTRD